MADLEPLIRVRKHAVEQKQKVLADLYKQADDLAAKKKKLEDDLAAEREKLKKNSSAEMMAYYNTYAAAVKDKIADILEDMRKLEGRIEVAREMMREAFAELKKIEITQERRQDEERRELNKKEAQILDESALDGYRRRQAEE